MRVLFLVLLLGGCATQAVPVRTVTQTVEVAVPAPCPDKAERERLRALRPAPLTQTPKPETVTERVARSLAQLGLYEAPGAWADQVDAALDRCQK